MPFALPSPPLPTGTQDGWVPVGIQVNECGCTQKALSEEMRAQFRVSDEMFMIMEPPFARNGTAGDCIQHKDLAALGVVCMILFSLCVQAAPPHP